MQKFIFKSLDGINMHYFINACSKMLYNEMAEVYIFDRKKYRWYVGINVFNRLRDIIGLQTITVTPIGDILGIDVVKSYAVEPNEIRLNMKPQWGSDTGDALKHAINSIYGTDAFVTIARHAGNTITSLKTLEEKMKKLNFDRLHDISINNIIFNDPATIIFWNDGTKTVVKAENEEFDPEKGLAMAIAKKVLGNKGNYYETFKKWLPKEKKESNVILKSKKETRFISVKEYAALAGVSESTIRTQLRKGHYPYAKKVNGKWQIPYNTDKPEVVDHE